MMRIDFQTHTRYSQGCGWMSPSTLVNRASTAGLDAVAITDHNTREAIQDAKRSAPDRVTVIPGEEIDTQQGQVIGIFTTEHIEPWQSVEETIEAIHAQGGIAFAPHPFDKLRAGLEDIESFVEQLDAIEILNSRCLLNRFNERAHEFAESTGLPGIGGSDAHFGLEVGVAYTEVDADPSQDVHTTFDSVKSAFRSGRVRAAGKRGTPFVHAGTKLLKLVRSWGH